MQEIVLITFQYKVIDFGTNVGESEATEKLAGLLSPLQLKSDLKLLQYEVKDDKYEAVFCVTLIGPFNQVIQAKDMLMKQNYSQVSARITVLRNVVLKGNGEMKPFVKKRLDDVKAETNTEIFMGGNHSPNVNQSIEIEIIGLENDVENARLQCLALLDELVPDY
jgi:hypothetical protein